MSARRASRSAPSRAGRSAARCASRRWRSRRSSSPSRLMLVNAAGLEPSTHAARLPDRLVPRVRARRPVHPGSALRDDERGYRPRARHPVRLPQPALADVAARLVAARSASSPGSSCSGLVQAVFYIARRARSSASTSRPAPAAIVVLARSSPFVVSLGFGALGSFLALRTGSRRGGAGPVPAAVRVPLHLVDEHAARPDRGRLVPLGGDANPVSYLIECVRSLIITGWDVGGARCSASGSRSSIAAVSLALASWALTQRMTRT